MIRDGIGIRFSSAKFAAKVWLSLGALVGMPFARAAEAATPEAVFIREYWVEGATKLPRLKVEEAVYRFLGPGRTPADVEGARAALEKAYGDEGFQTVGVVIPPQEVKDGIVRLQVVERPVGRLRVRGAEYSSPAEIKAMAPSLAEGKVIDFDDVPADMVGLNRLPDRQITPSLHAGVAPDTVDVDLEVKETPPVHASVELNNRQGPNTSALRMTAAVSANNLWQTGQGAGFTYQTSPQRPAEVKVYSGYYLMRFAGLPEMTLMLQGTKQDSNVSTLGNVAVAGRGQTMGLRALFNLPVGKNFSHSASVGLDYKHYNDLVKLGTTAGGDSETPITYVPLEASYAASWLGKTGTTELNTSVAFNLRGLGSKAAQFGNSRFNADANFLILRADFSRLQTLPGGFQAYGKVQGQVSDQPLIGHEQASGGGLGTVRGYLEAEAVGDNAAFGSFELRSPPLLNWLKSARRNDWRIYTFYEGGGLRLRDALPDQKNHFYLASYGFGMRIQLLEHFDAAINASIPQYDQAQTKAGDRRVTFRAALDF